MGGIAGFIEKNEGPLQADISSQQSTLLAHRGPVREEIWKHQRGAFIRRVMRSNASPESRGSIFHQNQGSWSAVSCGNILNRKEIASQLEEAGATPELGNDAELLLLSYLQWGLESLAKANGAFACAFYNRDNQTLVLVRDPLGLQSLIFWEDDQTLVFGSEAKAVIVHPRYSKQPDEEAIADFLNCNRYLLQNGKTFYKGVLKLLPGEALVLEQGRSKRIRYWQLDPNKTVDCGSDEECIETVRELMLDSTRLRVTPDEHCGAALSGGFDSSSVVCMMDHILRKEQNFKGQFHTFSYNFGSDDADEVDLIECVSKQANTIHHGIDVIKLDFFSELENVIRINDGPVLEGGVLLLWHKKQLAASLNVDILLSGLGGDELFMGRVNFLADLLMTGQFMKLKKEFDGLYPYDQSTGKKVSLKKLLMAYILSPLEPYWLRNFRKTKLKSEFPQPWISRDLINRIGYSCDLPQPAPPHFNTHYMQDCFEVFYYELLGGAAHYQDVASGAFGIDTRFPLMDIRLVELMFALPREWKIHLGRVRKMQKATMEPFLPKEILQDHLKKDFHPTLEKHLKMQYAKLLEPIMNSKDTASAEFLDWKNVKEVYRQFQSGGAKSFPLWCALNLERWLKSNF